MPRPQSNDYAGYASNYVALATGENIIEILNQSEPPLHQFLSSLPPAKAGYAYAAGKWTLRQMLQHMIDTERIFAYRALCIARGEQQNLPGFEENDYAAAADATERSWQSLVEEFELVRRSSMILFNSFDETALARAGKSNNIRVTVNALGFIMVGHVLHHENIIRERYLVSNVS